MGPRLAPPRRRSRSQVQTPRQTLTKKKTHVSTSVDVGAKEDAGTQGKDTKTEADVVVVKTGADVIKPNAGITATDNSTSQAKNAV